ncbi:uncharacterized protein LOC124375024, partial [Homalodisca vitripennis]|uniref:uncharacterized protein LOC124375024 n=1 Tax=Homalodisca vitripennis TaxID=197043 RepID=UPI001EEC6604
APASNVRHSARVLLQAAPTHKQLSVCPASHPGAPGGEENSPEEQYGTGRLVLRGVMPVPQTLSRLAPPSAACSVPASYRCAGVYSCSSNCGAADTASPYTLPFHHCHLHTPSVCTKPSAMRSEPFGPRFQRVGVSKGLHAKPLILLSISKPHTSLHK